MTINHSGKAVIAGIGSTKFGGLPGRTTISMNVEAIRKAGGKVKDDNRDEKSTCDAIDAFVRMILGEAKRVLDANDADLLTVAGRSGTAHGIPTHVFGRLLDVEGRPIAGARIEIWQCDAFGVYHHPRSPGIADPNFQGFGATVANADGAWRFRTIRPVPYPGRTPHIHFAVLPPGGERFITQMYVAGESLNDRDMLLSRVRDPDERARLIVPLVAADDLEPGVLAGRFDIVLGAA